MSSKGRGMAWSPKMAALWLRIQDVRGRKLDKLGCRAPNLSPHQARRKLKHLQRTAPQRRNEVALAKILKGQS